MSESIFHIGLIHFLVVSFLLLAAGIATMLTKRNAIGILIGVELVLNAASINFVAFNHYGWPGDEQQVRTAGAAMADHDRPRRAWAAAHPVAEGAGPQAPAEGSAIPPAPPVDAAATQPAATEESTAAAATPGSPATQPAAPPAMVARWQPTIDGQMFAVFIIVLAAAEAAVALAIFLNFYNNFSSIDVERADQMKG